MDESAEPLTPELKKRILDWCREILAARLAGTDPPPAPPLGDRRGGVFVTLKKNGRLRGCIGQFAFDGLLEEAIREMVLAAAFNDPRFLPLNKSELASLDVTVSVLTKPKPLKSLDDVVIGRDGLYLFHPHGRGVLLPAVATEHGFSPTEFARHTSVKAGLRPEAYQDPEAELLVFTAPAFSTDSAENEK
ncbi:MAG: AmmeMemoRadiSam system protein A [Deltaproteobacteria bacterium]|jgi:AmmeMemoRadiSam system protein A|nr:AmmeMemoRadiSam system protein A [Deltaproteobacteria bacterium]